MCDQRKCSIFWSCVYSITGLCLCGLGAWMYLDEMVLGIIVLERPDLDADSGAWFIFVLAIMSLGGYCLLAGIVGIIGSGCRHTGTIMAFMVLACIGTVITIVFVGLVTAAFITAYMDGVHESGEDNLIADSMQENLFTEYSNENSTDDFTKSWNRIQIDYECCGVENYTDYRGGAMANTSYLVPWSCCVTDDEHGDVNNLDACRAEAEMMATYNFTYLNPHGCEEYIFELYNRDLIIAFSFSVGALILQVISILVIGCTGTDLKHGEWSPGQ